MSQFPLNPEIPVDKVDVQTPAPKQRRTDCPPAPVKRNPKADTQGPSRQSLTTEQVRQLRISWCKTAKKTLDEQ